MYTVKVSLGCGSLNVGLAGPIMRGILDWTNSPSKCIMGDLARSPLGELINFSLCRLISSSKKERGIPQL